ncbi:ATP-binding protein, partial [Streptomyces sp. NPDC021562]|uniref:ATP-binding protein n=1 Tax=Streptomyces sp. NPDC021562 TaxID=3155121 RepID=UPI0033C141B8
DKNEYLEIVLSEIERINTIVGEFLFLAKPTADVFQKKNIKNIINDVVTFIKAQSNLYNTQIYTMMEDSIPMIFCEENRLKQVFLNLLQNSIEAMPNGGIIAITVKMIEGEQISIQIADQGMGIEEERLATLGEPFYTTKEKGTGLGLMTCYKIIEEGHRGHMSIESTVGKGTNVQIILPSLTQEMLGTSIHTKFAKE